MNYEDPEEFAEWLEAVADDARLNGNRVENINNRHPLSAFNLGVAFALRYAAYEARTIEQ